MIDRFEVIAQGLAADRNAVLDHFRCFAERQRVAFYRGRSICEIDILCFLQGKLRRLR